MMRWKELTPICLEIFMMERHPDAGVKSEIQKKVSYRYRSTTNEIISFVQQMKVLQTELGEEGPEK